MNGFVVDIADLAGNPGASLHIGEAKSFPGLKSPLAWVDEDEALEIDLVAENLREGVEVSGKVSGKLNLSCSRCLTEFEQPLIQKVDEIYYFNSETAERNEGYVVEAHQIDLEPMLRDVIVLNLPAHPLHDPDCSGLCPTCGADLNLVDCGHARRPADLRWAPLEAILSNGATESPTSRRN